MLPTVIFVGPTKCGTTWIDSYLRTRPEVGLPLQQKETFFFDKCFERGLAWYEAQFGTSSEIGVEVAPSLFHKSQARENLAKTLPNTRVVIVYRDPVDRAISHYFHFRKSGEPAMTIDDHGTRASQHHRRWPLSNSCGTVGSPFPRPSVLSGIRNTQVGPRKVLPKCLLDHRNYPSKNPITHIDEILCQRRFNPTLRATCTYSAARCRVSPPKWVTWHCKPAAQN